MGDPFSGAYNVNGHVKPQYADIIPLAQTIYDERSFSEIGIIADFLEENGCPEDYWLLKHLRTGKHYLGCIAIDRILGKD